jgi:hypothetical protein
VNRDEDGDEPWVLPKNQQEDKMDTEGLDEADIVRTKKRKRDQDVTVTKLQRNVQHCADNGFVLGEERVHLSVHSSMHAGRRHGSWKVVEVLQPERHADSHQLGLLRPDWNWVWNNLTHIVMVGDNFMLCRARYFPTQVPKELNPGVTHYFVNKGFANIRQNNVVVRTEEKSVSEMIRHILQTTEEGDLVVDFFMGTGTTGVACAQTGRRYIG